MGNGIFGYTRDGAFRLNDQKQLVDRDGHQVLDRSDSPITLDGKDLNIDHNGDIFLGCHRRSFAWTLLETHYIDSRLQNDCACVVLPSVVRRESDLSMLQFESLGLADAEKAIAAGIAAATKLAKPMAFASAYI